MAAEPAVAEGTLRSVDGTQLHWRGWDAGGEPVLAVVPGLGEHSGRYRRLARAMASLGVSTFAVDLRGAGRSEGPRGHLDRWADWVADLSAFEAMVRERSGSREVVLLGHSFGGVVVTSAVLAGAVRTSRFALSNPAFVLAGQVPAWKRGLGRMASLVAPGLALGNRLDPARISRDPAEVAAYRDDPLVHDRISVRLYLEWARASSECLRRAPELAIPCLILLSGADRIVDPEGGRRLARGSAAEATLREYPDRYHEPFNDLGADAVFADLADWLRRRPD